MAIIGIQFQKYQEGIKNGMPPNPKRETRLPATDTLNVISRNNEPYLTFEYNALCKSS